MYKKSFKAFTCLISTVLLINIMSSTMVCAGPSSPGDKDDLGGTVRVSRRGVVIQPPEIPVDTASAAISATAGVCLTALYYIGKGSLVVTTKIAFWVGGGIGCVLGAVGMKLWMDSQEEPKHK